MLFLALTMPVPGRQMKGYTMLADPIRRDHKAHALALMFARICAINASKGEN